MARITDEVATSADVAASVSSVVVVVVVVVVIVVVVFAVVVDSVVSSLLVVAGGQPSLENPFAIVSPSGQQPNAVMSQVMRTGHPSASGPAAGV